VTQPLVSPRTSAVDEAALILPVRQLLRSSTATILDWQQTNLGVGFGNPVSLGVYRFSGTASDEGVVVPWSLILKVAQSPANVGFVDFGEGPDQSHWNYWQRELLLFQSGLLENLPGGVAAPGFYGGLQLPGNIIWLWLEDVSTVGPAWTSDRYVLAAYHLGCFNGAYITDRPLPHEAWLSQHAARQFAALSRRMLPLLEVRLPGIQDHPVARFIRDSDSVLDALEGIPHTFCHFDAGGYNLMTRSTGTGAEETVAIDWALAGTGPVGAELSQLIVTEHDTRNFVLPANEAALIESYLSGLCDAGWRTQYDVVLLGYAAFMVFRLGAFFLTLLYQDLEAGGSVALDDTSIPALLPFVEKVQELIPGVAGPH
jgi:hypothetical protein